MNYPPAPPHQPNVIALPSTRTSALFHPPAPMRHHTRDWELEQLRRERDAAQAKLADIAVRLRKLHLKAETDDLPRLLARTERALAIHRHHRATPIREHSALHRAESLARGEHVAPVLLAPIAKLWDHLLTITQRTPTPSRR